MISGNNGSSAGTPRPAVGRRKKACFIVMLTAMPLLLFLLLAEGYMRFTFHTMPELAPGTEDATTPKSMFRPDPELGFVLAPGTYTSVYGSAYSCTYTIDDDGRRITRPRASAKHGRHKDEIWIFGCSLTFGISVNDDETYPWLLQKAFPAYAVTNFSVPGYGTVQSLLQFKQALNRGRRPALVVLGFSHFHLERNVLSRGWLRNVFAGGLFVDAGYPYARLDGNGGLRFQFGRLASRSYPWITYRSALANYLYTLYISRYNVRGETADLNASAVTLLLLREFADQCTAHGIPFVVAGLTGDDGSFQFLADRGYRVVYAAEDYDFEGSGRFTDTTYPYDLHPSKTAHRKFAVRIAEYLHRTSLLQTPPPAPRTN